LSLWFDRAVALAFLLSALAIVFGPHGLSALLLSAVVASTVSPWRDAWTASRGTGLRGALAWVALALVFLVAANLVALGEPLLEGRPAAGRLTYIAVLAFLAAFISVLNARVPGAAIWAGLMAVLVVVFLIPWLEGPTRLRKAGGLAPLHLDAPWTLFYLVLVFVAVTNYLPTRFGKAAPGFALGFWLEYLGLTDSALTPQARATIWSAVAWSLAASVWLARWCARRAPPARTRLERQWLWFRDAWGVVWALRILERFNREANLRSWPFRLGWFGLTGVGVPGSDEGPLIPEEADATMRGLLRRFIQPARLEEAK
jgi:hypothetical protein